MADQAALHAADLALKDKIEALQRDIDETDDFGQGFVVDRHLTRAELYAAGDLSLHIHLRVWPSDNRAETSDWCFVVKPIRQIDKDGRLRRFKDVFVVADPQMKGAGVDGCDLADEQPMFVLVREFPESAERVCLTDSSVTLQFADDCLGVGVEPLEGRSGFQLSGGSRERKLDISSVPLAEGLPSLAAQDHRPHGVIEGAAQRVDRISEDERPVRRRVFHRWVDQISLSVEFGSEGSKIDIEERGDFVAEAVYVAFAPTELLPSTA